LEISPNGNLVQERVFHAPVVAHGGKRFLAGAIKGDWSAVFHGFAVLRLRARCRAAFDQTPSATPARSAPRCCGHSDQRNRTAGWRGPKGKRIARCTFSRTPRFASARSIQGAATVGR